MDPNGSTDAEVAEANQIFDEIEAELGIHAPIKIDSTTKRVTYQCANPNCKELDSTAPGGKRNTRDVFKYFTAEGYPPAINCWKCKGGQKLTRDQQVAAHNAGQNRDAGMFPLPETVLEAVK